MKAKGGVVLLDDIKRWLKDVVKKLKGIHFSNKLFFIILICCVAILIPSFIAIWHVYLKSDDTVLSSNDIHISLLDIQQNKELVSEKINEKNISDSHTMNMLYTINSGKVLSTAPSKAPASANFKLTVSVRETSNQYLCYFSQDPANSYITDSAGAAFAVDDTAYKSFLSSEYSYSAYSSATPPTLSTEDGAKIIPYSVNWYFKKSDGAFERSRNYTTTKTKNTYQMHGALDLHFSVQPSSCTVEVSELAENKLPVAKLYEGDLDGLSTITAEVGKNLSLTVNASWDVSDDSEYHGNISYNFEINCTDHASFELSTDSAVGGDIISITLHDVNDLSSVIYRPVSLEEKADDILSTKFLANATSEQKEAIGFLRGFKPTFVSEGNTLYAFLPIPSATPAGSFSFTLSSGIATKTFTIGITERNNLSTVEFGKESPLVFDAITKEAEAEVQDIHASLSELCAPSKLFRTDFSDILTDGYIQKYSFCDNLVHTDKDTVALSALGNFYATGDATYRSVGALNVGKVVYTGNAARLGNFVIVDHGMGLCTWYCNLSAIDVAVSDVVAKGESVGKTGESTFLSDNGVLIICSVYNTLIDPNLIVGKNISIVSTP